ncbi:hypothetical protein M8J76_004450 [Diaphorina citri]|nr:hypothetical protein M8J76_004450 [Diaphorina citri]
MDDKESEEFNVSYEERVGNLPQNMLRTPNQAALNREQSNLNSSDSTNDDFDMPEKMSRETFNVSSAAPHIDMGEGGVNLPSGSMGGDECHNRGATRSPSAPVYNWQATKTTVKERFAFMFNNEILCDVHFIVGRETELQRIPAHRFVLSVGSVVFDAMFNGTLATRSDEIELPDVEPAAFLALLRFLYSDEVHIGPETVMTTLYTAKKYAVPALEKHCVDFLKSNLGSDNAFIWSEAECTRQSLPITPENQRAVLGPSLTLVRFPLMSVEEFAAGPAQSGLLEDSQLVRLFLYFHVNPKPAIPFFDGPRCSMTGKEQVVHRFQHIESRWGYSGTSDRIRFSVDRRIFVVGFGLYGCIHGPTEYDVQMQLVRTANGKVIAGNRTSFACDGSTFTSRVMFKEPVEVMPNISYTACATLKGPDSHYGTKGLRSVTLDCPSGGKVTFQFSYASGNNNGTSVEDGQIPEILFYS